MTDTINEQISAFTDGELPEGERELLLKRLQNDPELQATWQRYHLVRDALREDLPDFIHKKNDTSYIQGIDSKAAGAVIPGIRSGRFMKPLAGLAIAASVAVLSVVGVLYNGDRLGEPVSPRIADSSAPGRSVPESFTAMPRSGWQSARPAVVSHLNSYLVDHSSYAGFGSAQGIIPYSRVAGYDEPMPDGDLEPNEKKQNKESR